MNCKIANPIVLIILACQGREEAKAKGEVYNIKLRLIRLLYEKGHTQDEIRAIFEFIDWVIRLSEKDDELILEEIRKIEEVKKKPFVSSIERIIRKKAIKEGRKEGRKEGLLEKSREDILIILDERFGNVPSHISDSVNKISEEDKLRTLYRQAIRCSSLDEFIQMLDSQN